MKFFAIRPKRRKRRINTRVAVYTVAFSPGELKIHDSSFDYFCRNCCEFNEAGNCKEACIENGEYGRLLYIWRQQGYLIRYFKTFYQHIDTERYGHIDVQTAIERHKKLLCEVERQILYEDLGNVFVPLYKSPNSKTYHPENKVKSKIYFNQFENWIRVYAVRYTDDETGTDNYIITGGGIKLVEKMSDNSILEYEEIKQNKVIEFLITNKITTREKIETLIYENKDE